ncbi:aminotransferase class I and II [Alkalidesulfovibrio alkalitolerans DSM 16529]|jgi:aspartate/methionine/tyrosine aminotransferase|uniref:Aminotransferase n=1 Tax=Alkalidesulfovibrio alkalitolerans DSM 16529 TaxID=1121439 RepID=S7UUT3_9BACT|nr:pyridoxal phosphate-dependent aminotransferase [Alkalidesulfovibrio alkalitolerans]EPR36118.1 aminotransferase class I and II [Alkalidesulfovibrio alkalitolerans DSM 16529]
MKPSCRTSELTSFMVMDVLEAAQAMEARGEHVIHLEIGEPDFDTPEPVSRAAIRAIEEGRTHYTHSLGLRELREAIAADYKSRYGVDVSPDRILVTAGTSPAMLLLFAAILERGDEVVVSDPCYACYRNFIRFVDGVSVDVPVGPENGFQLTAEAVAKRLTPRTRAILVNSPANPTGTLLSAENMQGLADLCGESGPLIVSDEIYHGLVYEGRERCILEFTDRAFALGGFSKLYAMTGWRLGWLVAPEAYMDCLRKAAQNLFISAGSVAQWAGIAALTQCADHVERMRAVYDERRRFMLKRLREIGFTVAFEPTGAFYVLADARAFTNDSLAFAFELLAEARVGVTPGVDFGPGGEGFIRFSYANSIENIAEGMNRLERYLKERGSRP